MADRLLQFYSTLALAKQPIRDARRCPLRMEIPNYATLYIEALALISAPGISIYNGPLLMITARCWVITARLQAMYPVVESRHFF